MKIVRYIIYLKRLCSLAFRASAIWGVIDFKNFEDWEDQVRATPLKYKLRELEAYKVKVLGRGGYKLWKQRNN